MAPARAFDPATTSATELREQLAAGTLTSVAMVETHLAQIDRFNPHLRALISVRDREQVIQLARRMDERRLARRDAVDGADPNALNSDDGLCGVCVVVKDVFMTGEEMGMPTTGGAWAFRNAVAKSNATVVQRLVEKGFIILGKANLTEWCGLKGSYAKDESGKPGLFPGWSALGGQTQSPYAENGVADNELLMGHTSPGGSSSGSAVSVAAGFAPLALGTETAGSVITPANRAGLYAITLSKDRVPTDGMFRLSKTFDRVGAMAKTANDLALLMNSIIEEPNGRNFISKTEQPDWGSMSIGFVDPSVWSLPAQICPKEDGTDEQMKHDYEAAVNKIRKLGAKVEFPITLPLPSVLKLEEQSSIELVSHSELPDLFRDSTNEFENPPVRTLAELVAFNERNAKHAMPEPYKSQSELLKVTEMTTPEETIQRARKRLLEDASIDEALEKYGVDILAAPGDSALCVFAAAAGYPIGIVPLGALELNGRPFGICFVMKANQERRMLDFMRVYEASFDERPVPKMTQSTT